MWWCIGGCGFHKIESVCGVGFEDIFCCYLLEFYNLFLTFVFDFCCLKMRNKVGGNKAKKMGRKHVVVRDVALVVKKSELEHYGFVDKVFGGRLCSAVNTSGKKYKIHIRGKFKSNAIGVGSIILFGERDFASNKEDCDLLYVYEERDFGQLIGVESLVEMRNSGVERGGGGVVDALGLTFSMDAVVGGGGGAVVGGGMDGGGESVLGIITEEDFNNI